LAVPASGSIIRESDEEQSGLNTEYAEIGEKSGPPPSFGGQAEGGPYTNRMAA